MKRWLIRFSTASVLPAQLLFVGTLGAQQESPLSDRVAEEPAPKRDQAVSEKERAVGAEFRDNPKWVIDEQKKAEAAAAAEVAEEEGDDKTEARYISGYRRSAGLGLSPLAPQQQSVVPGGVTPVLGSPTDPGSFRFEFHGYLQSGLRAGIGKRDVAYEGQSKTTFHGDPVVAGGAFGWFEHTNTVPVPWAQMNFQFGNDVVQATAVLGAWSLTQGDSAAGYFQPPSKLGFYDAYVTYTPHVDPVGLRMSAGVFTERYGGMAQYHAGSYGTSLIGVIYGMGAASTVTLPYENDVTVTLEGGFKSDFNRPPADLVLDQSNEWVPTVEGSTYAAHGHAAFDFDSWVELTGHTIYSFSQDDRSDDIADDELYLEDGVLKDGSLLVLGADARFRLRRWGHLYLGASHIIGKNTQTLSNLVQVLNNGPGRDLTRRYFTYSSGGNGKMTFVGGQYDLSLGKLLRHPVEFYGNAPDLKLSLFGIYGAQNNEGDVNPESKMLKFGTELVYSPLRFLSLSGRFDAVMQELDEPSRSFAVLTPKLVFRSGWSNQATATLQYSGYVLGDDTEVRGDERLLNNPTGKPDTHLLALYGTIWW